MAEARYDGDPPFFTPDGKGVTVEYIDYLRALLGLKQGQSLSAAIVALRSPTPEGPPE